MLFRSYWASRLLAAMADASYAKSVFHIERYTLSAVSYTHLVTDYVLRPVSPDGAARPRARSARRRHAPGRGSPPPRVLFQDVGPVEPLVGVIAVSYTHLLRHWKYCTPSPPQATVCKPCKRLTPGRLSLLYSCQLTRLGVLSIVKNGTSRLQPRISAWSRCV